MLMAARILSPAAMMFFRSSSVSMPTVARAAYSMFCSACSVVDIPLRTTLISGRSHRKSSADSTAPLGSSSATS